MIISAAIEQAVAQYALVKNAITTFTGASQEVLHIHIGLLIFILSSLVLRKRFHSPIPLALVATFALLNEFFDWMNGPYANPWEPLWDGVNTVFWPVILFLVARRWR